MAVLTGLAATVTGAAVAVSAVEASQDSAVTVALIGTLGLVAAAGVTGVFALLARPRADPPPAARLVDEPTTHNLTREIVEMTVEAEVEAAHYKAEAAMWEQRARQLGWTEEMA